MSEGELTAAIAGMSVGIAICILVAGVFIAVSVKKMRGRE